MARDPEKPYAPVQNLLDEFAGPATWLPSNAPWVSWLTMRSIIRPIRSIGNESPNLDKTSDLWRGDLDERRDSVVSALHRRECVTRPSQIVTAALRRDTASGAVASISPDKTTTSAR
jgi:hypothetical protein